MTAGFQSDALMERILGTEGPKRRPDSTLGSTTMAMPKPTRTTSNAGGNVLATSSAFHARTSMHDLLLPAATLVKMNRQASGILPTQRMQRNTVSYIRGQC